MQRTRQRAVLVGTVLFVALLGILVQRGLWKGGLFKDGVSNDFHAYHVAARGVWERDLVPSYRDPQRPNLYPPPFAILISPLGLLPYRGALAVWVAFNAALVIYISRSMERVLGLPLPPLAKMAGLLLAFRLLESDFANGNANTLVLALIFAAFDVARRRGDGLAGVVLAVAILAKVSPVLILPWTIYRRRWRMLCGVITGGLLFGLVLPAVVLGPRGASEAWDAWRSVTLEHIDPGSESYIEESGGGYEPGQSLRTFIHRILRRSDATSHDAESVSIHVLELSKRTADMAYAASAAAILIGSLTAAWWRVPGVRLGWRAEEIAAACAAMVFCAPLSRKAHFVALWPAAVLGWEAWRLSEGRRLRIAGGALWFLALALVAGTSPGVLGRGLATRVLAYCPIGWAAALLLVLVSFPRFFPRGGRKVADIERERAACATA